VIDNPRGDPTHAPAGGNRIAIQNIHDRLAGYFGVRGRLDTSDADQRYRVTLTLPYEHVESPDRR
jgi:sensor histidine kinase YesM